MSGFPPCFMHEGRNHRLNPPISRGTAMKYYIAERNLVYTSTIKSCIRRAFRARSPSFDFSCIAAIVAFTALQFAFDLSISERLWCPTNKLGMSFNLSLSFENLGQRNIICSRSSHVAGHIRDSWESCSVQKDSSASCINRIPERTLLGGNSILSVFCRPFLNNRDHPPLLPSIVQRKPAVIISAMTYAASVITVLNAQLTMLSGESSPASA